MLALPLVLLPYVDLHNLTGVWYTIGWPIPSGSLKIGLVSPSSGLIHPHLLGVLLMLPLWALAICMIESSLKTLGTKIGRWAEVPQFLLFAAYACVVVAFGLGIHSVWHAFWETIQT